MQRRRGTAALVAGGLALATTANARKPFARDGWGAIGSFASGLLTSELPRETAALQVATLAGLAATGRVHGTSGRLATLATAGSVAGLLGIHRQAARSGAVLEDALVQGLGADYRAHLGAYPAAPAEAVLSRADIRVRSARTTAGSRRGPVLSYGDAGRRNQLDIWRRPDLPLDAKAPVLLQVHGGGVGHRQQGPAGHAAHGPPGRAGLGLRGHQLPPQPPSHLARPHRRREAGHRLGQGQHRRPRRRPRLRRHHRRLGRRPPVVARRPHARTSRVPARLRGGRHLGRGRRAVLRRLRLDQPRRHRPRRHGGHPRPAGPQDRRWPTTASRWDAGLAP